MGSRQIGILALQGAFARHAKILKSLNVTPCLVRYPSDLENCDALIIPGGESTTLTNRVEFIGLRDPIIRFAQQKPIFGTCAGLIMLSKDCDESLVKPFGILDIEIERNGYGTQCDSFTADIVLSQNDDNKSFHAIFIRAPKITAIGPEIQVLASFDDVPVLIQQGHHLGAAFHPELTDDNRIHCHLLKLIYPS